jgi:uridine kinase
MKSSVLSLCGGSGSGKSTLAKALAEHYGAERAVRIQTDLFLQPNPFATLAEYRRCPLKYDWGLLRSLLAEESGSEIALPDFDFNTFRRIADRGEKRVRLAPLVILDGMLPYPAADYTICVALPDDQRQERIRERDARWKTWVIDAWEQHQLTLQMMADSHPSFDLVVDGQLTIAENIRRIMEFLRLF